MSEIVLICPKCECKIYPIKDTGQDLIRCLCGGIFEIQQEEKNGTT